MKQKLTTILLSVFMLILMAFVSIHPTGIETSVGSYSLSLNVQDISKSQAFYSKLGFAPDGNPILIDQH